jgi:hypothetical protein
MCTIQQTMRIFHIRELKARGIVTIIEDLKRTVPLGEKINMKYLGTLDHPIPKMILDSAKKGNNVLSKLVQNSFLLGILLKCSDPVKSFSF